MALYSIKDTGQGGDFDSVSAFEGALPTSGATTEIGEFQQAFTDDVPVSWSFNTSLTVSVTVAAAYRCNGAVSGGHAELKYSVNNSTNLWSHSNGSIVSCEFLRLVRDGSTDGSADTVDNASTTHGTYFNQCVIIRRGSGTTGGRCVRDTGKGRYMNSLLVDSGRNSAAIDANIFTNTAKIYHCKIVMSDGLCLAIVKSNGASAVVDMRNSAVVKADAATTTTGCCATLSSGTFDAACDRNVTTDATAPGGNPQTNKNDTDLFTSLTVGSENSLYPSRDAMVALGAGNDLSATVGSKDIRNVTRAEFYPGSDYIPAVPTLTSVNPSSGPPAGNTPVTLTGTSFTDATSVTFGGVAAANVVVVNDTTITCTTPEHAAGQVSVIVTTPGGQNTANSAYSYSSPANRRRYLCLVCFGLK